MMRMTTFCPIIKPCATKPFSLSLNDLVITPQADPSMGLVSTGETKLGGGLNFLSGGDTATIIFYSAGATLGVIGKPQKARRRLRRCGRRR